MKGRQNMLCATSTSCIADLPPLMSASDWAPELNSNKSTPFCCYLENVRKLWPLPRWSWCSIVALLFTSICCNIFQETERNLLITIRWSVPGGHQVGRLAGTSRLSSCDESVEAIYYKRMARPAKLSEGDHMSPERHVRGFCFLWRTKGALLALGWPSGPLTHSCPLERVPLLYETQSNDTNTT